jgi:spore coat protein U-like protein
MNFIFRRKEMRKYLLLATTAMLFAGNAMAGSVETGGQSAILNVQVNVQGACQITEASDFNYGNVWLTADASDAELEMSSEGTITTSSDYIAKFDEYGTPGSFKIECPDGVSASWNAGCAEGLDSGSGVCRLAIGDDSVYITVNEQGSVTTSSETVYLPSKLRLDKEAIGNDFDAPAVKVTLSY